MRRLEDGGSRPEAASDAAGLGVNRETVELDFREASINDILSLYFRHSCVLLRNFVPPEKLIAVEKILDQLYDKVGGLHIVNPHLHSEGLPSLHDLVFDGKHRTLLGEIFGPHDYSEYRGTSSRRIDPTGPGGTWMLPLLPHIDAYFHDFEFTVNFWVPLQACGNDDRPSLGVVAAGFADVLQFCGYDGRPATGAPDGEWNMARFDRVLTALQHREPEALRCFHSVFDDRIRTPQYRLGDAMMLSNWSLHFTHATPAMRGRRSNIELRFSSSASLQDILHLHAISKDEPDR